MVPTMNTLQAPLCCKPDVSREEACTTCGLVLPYTKEFFTRQRSYLLKTCKRCWSRSVCERVRRQEAEAKPIVLRHYGNGSMSCLCCRESIAAFLTVDHVNGGGNEHRKRVAHNHLYSYLYKNNFPDGYGTLCMNCNWCDGRYGHCVHKGPIDDNVFYGKGQRRNRQLSYDGSPVVLCRWCDKFKPQNETGFYPNDTYTSGFSNKCIECCIKSVTKPSMVAARLRRQQVLRILGGDHPACNCCGCSVSWFLTVDHINNDGAADRRLNGSVYHRILKGKPTPPLQLLCMNCNFGKDQHVLKICPHRECGYASNNHC